MEGLLKDFDIPAKRPSEEAQQRWRSSVSVVLNRGRRFCMVSDLAKRSEDRNKILKTQIRNGEAVGIIGPSGTGNSTILKIIAGLLAPDKIFQSAALFDSLTVRENVGFLLDENSSMPDDQIAALVTETLAAVGVESAVV